MHVSPLRISIGCCSLRSRENPRDPRRRWTLSGVRNRITGTGRYAHVGHAYAGGGSGRERTRHELGEEDDEESEEETEVVYDKVEGAFTGLGFSAQVHTSPLPCSPWPDVWVSVLTIKYSDAKVANRSGWEMAYEAVSRRPPISLYYTIVARTEGYTYAAKVWDLSIVQGPFSVAPCRTLTTRFATFSSPQEPGAYQSAVGPLTPKAKKNFETKQLLLLRAEAAEQRAQVAEQRAEAAERKLAVAHAALAAAVGLPLPTPTLTVSPHRTSNP
jgi:hypothetical protein